MNTDLYDKIGIGYDSTRSADKYILSRIVDLLDASKGAKILDIACGTGNYTTGVQKNGYNMIGIDISEEMLNYAKEKSSEITWIESDVLELPFEEKSFDGAMCTLAIHHFSDLKLAFKNIYRVMRNGKFVIMTCSHRQIKNYWLYRYFPKTLDVMMTYMPDYDVVVDSLVCAGFRINKCENYFITKDLCDNFLGSKIDSPECYLDPEFRKGMSIFAAKSNADVVNAECENLRAEIESGECKSFLDTYFNPYGDYMFIVAEKKEK